MRSTLSGTPRPPGSVAHTAAQSLAIKRRRAAARAWPDLAAALGDRFPERFADFAAGTPLPGRGGALADGRVFAVWLRRRGELPEAARLELMAVDLRYRAQADGLVARRGPSFRVALLRQPRCLVLALRWPGLGEWWY